MNVSLAGCFVIVFSGGKFVVDDDVFSLVVVGLVGQDSLPW